MTAAYKKASLPQEGRVELHELLALTGAEISLNALPEGAAVPFVHTHKENEEIYIILAGEGEFFLDGTVEPLKEGDAVRVDPRCVRALRATRGPFKFICVQVKAGSLTQFTAGDAAVPAGPLPDWLKK